MTKEEQIIQFLNSKLKNSDNKTVSVSRRDLPDLGLTEQEVMQAINTLENDGRSINKPKDTTL